MISLNIVSSYLDVWCFPIDFAKFGAGSTCIFVDSIPVVESWKMPWCSDSFFPEARTSLVPFPFLLVECPFLFILSGQIIMFIVFHWHETCSQLWGWFPAIEFPWFQVGSRSHRSLLNLPRFYPPRGHSTQPGPFWCWTKISSQIFWPTAWDEGRSLFEFLDTWRPQDVPSGYD